MVLVARTIEDDSRIRPLGKMDYTVRRNAFGRQRESFEADIDVRGLESPYHAVFIRAPLVTAAGPGVETLATIEQGIVAVRDGPHMAFAFHPELTPDLRLHRLFLDGLG
jgi:5'-phosphate synthase pdxT subunit